MFGFFKKKKKVKKDALISLLESLPIIYDSAENEQKMIDFFDAIICYANKLIWSHEIHTGCPS